MSFHLDDDDVPEVALEVRVSKSPGKNVSGPRHFPSPPCALSLERVPFPLASGNKTSEAKGSRFPFQLSPYNASKGDFLSLEADVMFLSSTPYLGC